MNDYDEEDPFIGPRRPASGTNRAHRHCALTRALRMNASVALKLASVYLLHFQQTLLVSLPLLIVLLHAIQNNAPAVVVNRLKLTVITSLAVCGRLLEQASSALRTVRDILFVRRSEHQRESNGPERKRTIDSLTELEAYSWTRFTKAELVLLLLHFRLPEYLWTRNRYRFTGEEVLIFCLTRIALGLDFTELVASKFGGSSTRWSEAFKWFIEHLYFTFYHRITGNSMMLWIEKIDEFRRVICYKVNAEPVEIHGTDANGNGFVRWVYANCDPATFRIFGFIDDTGVQTCRPGGSWGFTRTVQRIFYRYEHNGCFTMHVIPF